MYDGLGFITADATSPRMNLESRPWVGIDKQNVEAELWTEESHNLPQYVTDRAILACGQQQTKTTRVNMTQTI